MGSLVISCLALLFTVVSFWWMQWRPGNLVIADLQHFAAGRGWVGGSDEPNGWFVGLPLIMLNTGASPLVLESLRLTPAKGNPASQLIFNGVDTMLWSADPDEKSEHDFTYLPRIIKPNGALAANVQFLWTPSELKYEARRYHFFLEAKISGARDWQKVKDIELNFSGASESTLPLLDEGYRMFRYDG
ncbi:hypothetical protein A3K87_05035 [Variovorax paradoxus]|uniref:Uncharacterized protein n=1 Tax=Variovorax paradoxus TaxID=34073 RepID=A0AA91ID91_VARPD|nr:hypothetical protein [Variovorax paradoxus]OAK66911.1 hypothetical protein A3K87_05035 [Variovorax paradoxus]